MGLHRFPNADGKNYRKVLFQKGQKKAFRMLTLSMKRQCSKQFQQPNRGLSIVAVAETNALCSFVDMTSSVPTGTGTGTLSSADMLVAPTQREER